MPAAAIFSFLEDPHMHSSLRHFSRPAVTATLTLSASLLSAACSSEAISTGPDGPSQPTLATLTIAREGTSPGTITSSPAGIDCGATCSADFPAGSTITLTATPDAGAEFVGWSGGGCTGAERTCVVTVDDLRSVTATFGAVRYPVTIDLGGSSTGMVTAPLAGISCPGTCTGMIAHGGQLELFASAGASSHFVGWTVGPGGTACAGTGACATTISGPTTIKATFACYQSLEVAKAGTGNGTVTSGPAGIDCGSDCSEAYPPGTSVTLTATPAGDSTFTGWSGGGCSGTGPCSVDVNSAMLVTANFQLRQYTLTVSKAGTGAHLGTVTSSSAGISCDYDCTEVYSHGTMVTLTASPATRAVFAGWSGGGCTGTGTCTVAMTAATSVTATFTATSYQLYVLKDGSGGGYLTFSPEGTSCGSTCREYPPGTVVTIAAYAAQTSTFAGWSGGGCSGTGTCTITLNADVFMGAKFYEMHDTLRVIKDGGGSGLVWGPTIYGQGIDCGGTCSAVFVRSTKTYLVAVPSPGSVFAGWSGGGCTGTGTCDITMLGDTTVTATFVPAFAPRSQTTTSGPPARGRVR